MTSGTYLLYAPSSSRSDSVFAMLPDDPNQKRIPISDLNGFFDVSANGRIIAYQNNPSDILDILNTTENKRLNTSLPPNNLCVDISVSSDGEKLACGSGKGSYQIYFKTLDGSWEQLTTSSKSTPGPWGLPHFSPDGKWLAYLNLSEMTLEKEDGLYLADTNCFTNIDGCQSKIIGPVFGDIIGTPGIPYIYSWSPDSNSIAWLDSGRINIFNIKDKRTFEIGISSTPYAIFWSPVGDVIAYGDTGIDLISPDGNSRLHVLDNAFLLGWLVVPWKFNVGEVYKTTSKGDKLNVRALPSRISAVVEVLKPDEQLTILDGPQAAEGYVWWRVRTGKGIEGWVVDIPDWFQPYK